MPGARSAAAPPLAGLCPRGPRHLHSRRGGGRHEGVLFASGRSGIEQFHWQSSEDVAAVAAYLHRQREHHSRAALLPHLERKDGVTAPPQVGRRPF